MGWVDAWVGLGWVGSRLFGFWWVGLGWVWSTIAIVLKIWSANSTLSRLKDNSCIGLGRIGSVSWWVGLDRFKQNGPMDNYVIRRKNLAKIGRVVPGICLRTDTQTLKRETDRHAHRNTPHSNEHQGCLPASQYGISSSSEILHVWPLPHSTVCT